MDSFLEDIRDALDKSLDPKLFEACAADLLRAVFPTLVPIPGGNDAGMDGAIADGKGPAFGLVCTTDADVLSNLRQSLRSYKKHGGVRRHVVSATSRKLTARRRRNLEAAAANEGFTLVQNYERDAIANLLYHSPRWCKDLLNLTGQPPALSLVPKLNRPVLDSRLIGRDSDLEWLKSTPGDLLLVGQPGAGKTALLHQFVSEGGGLFVASTDTTAIANGLREHSPASIVLDDAHTRCELAAELCRVKREMDGSFRIIADCWPGARDEVAASLGLAGNSIRELELLTRDEIVHVINGAGICGPTALVRELVDQAAGKPGLAVTLTHLCMRDGVGDVALGTALSRDVRLSFERMVGRDAIPVLAAFALGGEAGMPLERVAEKLRLPLTTIVDLVTGLAAGGVLLEQRSGLAVWPATLRFALVRDTFFKGSKSIPLNGFAEAVPDKKHFLLTLIGARACGANVPDGVITDLLEQIGSEQAWRAFASLGERETLWVLDHHAEKLIDVARAALNFAPIRTVPMLLEQAIGDTRSLNGHPDQPLRILQDWTCSARPGTDEVLRTRSALAKSAIDWLRKRMDVSIALRAIEYAMSPDYRTHETNPGSGMTVTFTHGFITRTEVQQLRMLWADVAPVLHEVGIEQFKTLTETVRRLVYPFAMNVHLDQSHRRAMRSVARQMVRDIAGLAASRPAVLAWCFQMAKELRIRLSIHVPDDFLVLSPIRESADWRRAQNVNAKAAAALGDRWSSQVPETIAERIVFLEREADALGKMGLPWTHAVCQGIATTTEAPMQWAACLLSKDARPELLGPFVERAINLKDSDLPTFAERCLEARRYRPVGAIAILGMETPPRDLLTSVLSYLSEFPSLINVWCLRGEVAPQHLRLLLEHEDADVAVAAATGMRHAIGKAAIPMALRPIWRRAILRSGAEQDNLLGAFDGDSELAFEWLSMRMRAHPELFLHHDHNIGAAVDVLTFDQRGRLIDEVPDHPWLDDFLKKLIGDNLQLYQRLLRRSDVDRMHFVPLEGKPTSNWIQKVAAALDVGYAPSNIVRALEHQLWGWEGSESSTMARWIAAFEPLTKSADMRIREVALLFNTLAESRRSAALVRERREAVYGRD